MTILTCLAVWRYLRGADTLAGGESPAGQAAGTVESSAAPLGSTS
jgi:hypothetical protein